MREAAVASALIHLFGTSDPNSLTSSFRRGGLLADGTLVGDLGSTSHSEAAEQAFRDAGSPMPDYGSSLRARIAHAQREARMLRIAVDPDVSIYVDVGCAPTVAQMRTVGLLHRSLRPLPVVWDVFSERTGEHLAWARSCAR